MIVLLVLHSCNLLPESLSSPFFFASSPFWRGIPSSQSRPSSRFTCTSHYPCRVERKTTCSAHVSWEMVINQVSGRSKMVAWWGCTSRAGWMWVTAIFGLRQANFQQKDVFVVKMRRIYLRGHWLQPWGRCKRSCYFWIALLESEIIQVHLTAHPCI